MSGKTKIEWCDATWNVTAGCSKVSTGCAHCFAERVAWRLSHNPRTSKYYNGIVSWETKQWTGEVRLLDEELSTPLHWKKPRRIFVNSMSDLFHEKVPFSFIDKVFSIMALCPQHTFMVVTKRSRRMREYFESMNQPNADCRGESCAEWLMSIVTASEWGKSCRTVSDFMRSVGSARPNVMLGVSVENQATADVRIADLIATPAAKRFVSFEPGIGRVVFKRPSMGRYCGCPQGCEPSPCDNWQRGKPCRMAPPTIDWVIMGCESGPNARPMHPDWARSVRDQCKAAQVPFFLKQMMVDGKLVKMPELDGVVHDAMPEVKR